MEPVYPDIFTIDKYNGCVFFSCGIICQESERLLVPIKTFKSKKGYLMCRIDNKLYYIHRIIAEIFLEDFNNKLQINHIDGNKLNNNITNLEVCTNSENMRHAIKNGLVDNKGSKNGMAKLTEDEVSFIKRNLNSMSEKELAGMFNVNEYTIKDIRLGRTWRHL